ncbi:unnamed protein product [Pylaiella littoralis]
MVTVEVLAKRAATALVSVVIVLADGKANLVAAVGGDADECRNVPGLPSHVQLNNGVSVPRIGFGTAGLGHATEEAVSLALTAGYRHVDTAQAQEWYREDAVGRAVRRATSAAEKLPPSREGATSEEDHAKEAAALEGDGGGIADRAGGIQAARLTSGVATLSREDVFVTTKIHPRDFGIERMTTVVNASNGNLQGIDLLLLHSPFCWPGSCPDNPTPWQDGWRELEKLYNKGAVRAIGVSNFSEDLLQELLQMATVMPAAVQNWMDPFHQDRAVRALCSKHGIAYVAYSTLGGQWAHRPSSSSSPNPVSADPTLEAIASAHGRSVHAVALSWALQSGAIILPRSSNSERIGANLRTFVKGIDGTSSSIKDDDAKGSADDGGGGADQACRVGESKHGAAVHVFLTDEDVDAINRLDGTIGR